MALITDSATFDAKYWDHQPPEVKAAFDQATRPNKPITLPERMAALKKLEGQNDANGNPYLIDNEIWAENWGPWEAMNIRQMFGYLWVVSGIMPEPQIPPSFGGPEGKLPIPPGGIKVSLDSNDYPVWVKRT